MRLLIQNRHIQCLESAGVRYIAVSHAWHPDISVANQTKEPSPAASVQVVEMLLKTVMATLGTLVVQYDGPFEVWYDYFNVPQ